MDSLTFNLAGYPLTKARKLLRIRRLPRWLSWSSGGVGGLLIYLVALIALPGIASIISPSTHLLLIFSTYLLSLALTLLTIRRTHAIANSSPLFSGNLVVSLSDEGLTLRSDEETLFRKCSAVTDVIEDANGLIILSKGFAFLPIPVSAFGTFAARNAFVAACRAHISEGKVQP